MTAHGRAPSAASDVASRSVEGQAEPLDHAWDSDDGLTSARVSGKAEDEDRLDRDRERSTEAHWRAAEEAAESEPTQTPPENSELPGSKRGDVEDDLRKPVQPETKKP